MPPSARQADARCLRTVRITCPDNSKIDLAATLDRDRLKPVAATASASSHKHHVFAPKRPSHRLSIHRARPDVLRVGVPVAEVPESPISLAESINRRASYTSRDDVLRWAALLTPEFHDGRDPRVTLRSQAQEYPSRFIGIGRASRLDQSGLCRFREEQLPPTLSGIGGAQSRQTAPNPTADRHRRSRC